MCSIKLTYIYKRTNEKEDFSKLSGTITISQCTSFELSKQKNHSCLQTTLKDVLSQ